MDTPLVNRVANSGIVTLDLEMFFPKGVIKTFDLKDYLKMGLVLMEKDFREALKQHDWAQYQDAVVLVYCSTDAIIPVWAYMLVAAYAQPIAKEVFQGNADTYYTSKYEQAIAALPVATYEGQRVVIKGCSDQPVPPSAYLAVTAKLLPVAQSIMYGEPCSTVPVYKKKMV